MKKREENLLFEQEIWKKKHERQREKKRKRERDRKKMIVWTEVVWDLKYVFLCLYMA